MITQEEIQQFFNYNEKTGIVTTRLIRSGSNHSIGDCVGAKMKSHDKYYLFVKIKKTLYPITNIIWLYMTGSLPSNLIDHIDHNTLNNKWENLREATSNENAWNYSKPITNTSGVKGLYKRTGKGLLGWQIRVMITYKAVTKSFPINKYENSWEKAREAAIIYLQELRITLHGDFANHG